MAKFSPKMWNYVAANVNKAVSEDVPTIAGYREAFGEQAVSEWIYEQVLAIYAASPNKDTTTDISIRDFARGFMSDVGGYRLTELMLFFCGYRIGKFGTFYGSFDARQIGAAFYNKFVPYIREQRGKFYRKEAQKAYLDNRFTAPEGYSPLSIYQKLKSLADRGDAEAAKMLHDRNVTTESILEFFNTRKI